MKLAGTGGSDDAGGTSDSGGVLLVLDTSTYYAGVGVSAGGHVFEKSWRSQNNHGAELLAAAEELLRDAGSELREVRRVAVALGPGGFSALRVGIATAKGIASPKGLPVVGVSTFDIESVRWWPQARPLVAVIDAGSAGLYWALYAASAAPPPAGRAAGAPPERPEGEASPPASSRRTQLPGPGQRRGFGVAAPAELLALVPGDAVFCGEGVEKLSQATDAGRKGRILSSPGPTRRPGDLIRLAEARFAEGDVDDPARLVPFYARQPSITRPRDPAR